MSQKTLHQTEFQSKETPRVWRSTDFVQFLREIRKERLQLVSHAFGQVSRRGQGGSVQSEVSLLSRKFRVFDHDEEAFARSTPAAERGQKEIENQIGAQSESEKNQTRVLRLRDLRSEKEEERSSNGSHGVAQDSRNRVHQMRQNVQDKTQSGPAFDR